MSTTLPTTTDYYDSLYPNTSETSMSPCFMQTDDMLGPTFRPLLLWTVCVVGSLGNGLVLWVLLMSRVRGMADMCLLNLAVADLLLALLLPLWAHTGSAGGADTGAGDAVEVGWGAGSDALCKVKAGVYQLGFASGLLFVTLMSLDRYLAIVHAVRSSAVRKLHYSLLASGAVWAFALTFATVKAVFYVSVEGRGCVMEAPTRTWILVHNFGEIALCLGLCLPVLTFCYVSILLVVRQQKSSKKGRAVRLIFAIVCVFVVFWVPYNVAVLLQTLAEWTDDCGTRRRLEVVVAVTEVITLMHCCVNPVIYAFVGEKFRKSFAAMFVRYRLCRKLCPVAVTSPHGKPSDNETSNTGVSSSRIE